MLTLAFLCDGQNAQQRKPIVSSEVLEAATKIRTRMALKLLAINAFLFCLLQTCHVMSRGDQREDIFLCDVDRYDFLKTLSDPRKLAIAARLRQETTLSIKQIAERLHLGKPKGAKTNLHKSLNPSPRLTSEFQLGL